jgi:hypothetical protein
LLDQVRHALRLRHYSLRTEEAYLQWIRRFIVFHGKRHPNEMGADDVHTFLTHLAVEGEVAASTQPSGTRQTSRRRARRVPPAGGIKTKRSTPSCFCISRF